MTDRKSEMPNETLYAVRNHRGASGCDVLASCDNAREAMATAVKLAKQYRSIGVAQVSDGQFFPLVEWVDGMPRVGTVWHPEVGTL